jgi:preprotein translocase subunit SecG
MLSAILTLLHIGVCLVLIIVVLLQTGKRADLAGAFGGGGSQTAFGARGAATLLSKFTTIAAVLFMLTSLSLAILSTRGRTRSTVLDTVPAPSAPAPVQPPPSPEPQTPQSPAPTQNQGPAPTQDQVPVPVQDPAAQTPSTPQNP